MERRQRRERPSEIRLRSAPNGRGRVLSGYAVIFGEKTVLKSTPAMVQRETIQRGAFAATLAERREVVLTFGHDMSKPLGSTLDGSLRLREDGHGLYMEADLPSSGAGNDLAARIKRGEVWGASFGYEPRNGGEQITERKEADRLIVEAIITAAYLFDVGPVFNPAYKGTTVQVSDGPFGYSKGSDRWKADRKRAETVVRLGIKPLAYLELPSTPFDAAPKREQWVRRRMVEAGLRPKSYLWGS